MIKKEKTDIFRQAVNKHQKYLYLIVFLSIFVATLPVLPIVYMRAVFGPVINSQSVSFLFSLAGVLIVGLALNGVLEWIRERVMLSGTISLISSLEEKIFRATFEQKIDRWSDGTQAFSGLRVLRNFMVSPIAGAIFDAPFSLLFLVLIFLIHPLMGAFSLFGLFVALLVGILIEKKVAPNQEEASLVQNQARRELTYMHNNPLYCNSMGNLPFLFNKWYQNQKKFLIFQAKASSMQALGSSVSQVVMMVQGSMLLGVGTLLMLTGMMSMNMAGNLIIAKFIGALAIRPTMMIVMGWSQIIAVREALRDLRVFLDEIEETNESGIKLPPPTGSLAVSEVTYQQNENSKKILDTVNFALKPGCVCAVLGESGAGKSTLGRLLVGFLKPSKGVIRLDGVAIDTWNKVQLCDHIGYLPQDIQLFAGNVWENITRFKSIDKDELELVCKDFDIPQIYDSYANQRPYKLGNDLLDIPGGLKQKIALARTFYKSPKFIVLDEPTSSLDAQFENKFLDIIKTHKEQGALIVIITHNKEILKMADYILALKEGRQKLFDTKENIKTKMKMPL